MHQRRLGACEPFVKASRGGKSSQGYDVRMDRMLREGAAAECVETTLNEAGSNIRGKDDVDLF